MKMSDDPADRAIPGKVYPLVVASFLMSVCNTMQSVLYVPAALAVTGSPRQASVLLASLHSLCAILDIFVAPTFGAITDTMGRRKPLLLLSAALCFCRFLMLGLQNKTTLIVSRMGAYFTASLFSNTLVAAILDLTHDRPELAPVLRARDSSAKGWGVVLGPWMAGFLAKQSFGQGMFGKERLPFVASGLFGILCFLWAGLVVKETLPKEQRKPFKPKAKKILGFLELVGKGPVLNRAVLMYLLCDMTARTSPIFAVTTQTMFGWDTEKTGRWLMLYGLGMAVGPGMVSPYNLRKYGPRGAHFREIIGATVAMWMLALSKRGKMFWGALLVYVFSLGAYAGARNLATRAGTLTLPDMGRGELTGAFSSLGSVSNMLSPQLYAWIFAICTRNKAAPTYFPGVPFALAGTCGFLYLSLLRGVPEDVLPRTRDRTKGGSKKTQ